MTTLIKILLSLASVAVTLLALAAIVLFHVLKFFIHLKMKIVDPFLDSRRHPLNDPHAPRG
ncbi:MAG: hypothetical protein HQL26_07435 [Candidatus Omnitrophica bacterium]|nr:hypothetical protein [Candidatus Omnitrophota bacterium]